MPVAIVTGGSRGIGAAVCKILARDGYDVAVNYNNNAEAAESVVQAVQAQGRKAVAVKANVGSEDDVVRMFEEVDKALGPCSALVNNAGILGKKGPVVELTAKDVEASLAVNVAGPIYCSREAIKRMEKLGGGSIVNISSGSAHIGNPHSAVLYATTKGALNSFNIGLSQEVAEKNIRVNAVAPGMTATDMIRPDADFSKVPMKRAGKPEEIAEVVAFLVSDRASFTAGANIRVSGGRP